MLTVQPACVDGIDEQGGIAWSEGRAFCFCPLCEHPEKHIRLSLLEGGQYEIFAECGCDEGRVKAALERLGQLAGARNGASELPPEEQRPPSVNSLNSYPVSASPGTKPPFPNSFNSLNSYTAPEIRADPQPWPGKLAPEAGHGIAGEIVRALAPETEADPAALLMNLLITFGNAVGRGPHARVGATRHGANLFAALVGRTGEARKGTSWDPIRDMFDRALPGYLQEHVHGGIASGEGLLSLVRDRVEKRVQIKDKRTGRMTMEYETVVEDEGVDDKRALVIEAEMSGLLKTMNRSGNILAEQLQKAWDSGDLQNQNKNSPLRATGAHISVIGHITPDILRRLLTEVEAASGFGNRFLWVLCRRSHPLPEGGDLPYLNSYITRIRELVELASGKINIGRDADARSVWAAIYEELTRPGVGMFGEMTARRAPIVLRLSMIYALLDGVTVISRIHLLAALAVWERCEASVRFLFGDATGDPTADALYEALLQRPEGAMRTDLHGALGRNRSAADIDRGLTALLRVGKTAMEHQKTGERTVEVWKPLKPINQGNACPYLKIARNVVPVE